MKLLEIVKTVGGAVVRNAVPGGGLLVDVVNEFLPYGKKLPAEATGYDIASAVDSLPAEQRAPLMSREFDVQLEQHHTLQAMLQAEQCSTHTTRPRIALGAFHLVAFVSIVAISLWAYAVAVKDDELVAAVTDGWPFIAAVVGPFVTLLWAYFGILKQEQRNRMNAALRTSTPSGTSAIINNILKRR